MYNVDVYQGASGTLDEDGLGATVVLRMLEPMYNKNHHVYMDNFFSSVKLANKLKPKGSRMIGTTRTDRKGWPKNLKVLTKLNKQMKRGECQTKIVDEVQCLVWKDRKVVPIINTISNPNNVFQVMRRNKDGTRSPVPCPDSVRLYNSYMGGVDLLMPEERLTHAAESPESGG